MIGAADGVITAGAGADVTVPFVIEGSGSRGESTMLPKMRTSAMEARPARKMMIDINVEQYLTGVSRQDLHFSLIVILKGVFCSFVFILCRSWRSGLERWNTGQIIKLNYQIYVSYLVMGCFITKLN